MLLHMKQVLIEIDDEPIQPPGQDGAALGLADDQRPSRRDAQDLRVHVLQIDRTANLELAEQREVANSCCVSPVWGKGTR